MVSILIDSFIDDDGAKGNIHTFLYNNGVSGRKYAKIVSQSGHMTPSSLVDTVPSPSLSNNLKACRNSE
jgi:hypothetical protein